MRVIQLHWASRAWTALLAAFVGLLLAQPAFAAPKAKTPNVEISLVADKAEAAPGETVNIAFIERIRPGWHTYWRNPGDAGEPTRINWTLPRGYSVGDIIWPAPERIPVGPLANYGFKGEVRLVSPVTVSKTAKPGDLAQIKASATWQVCEEVCIPEGASVDLVIRIAAQSKPNPQGAAIVQSALEAAPKLVDWPASFDAASASLSVHSPDLTQAAAKGELRGLAFYPYEQAMIDPAPEQKAQFGAQGVTLTLPLQPGFEAKGAVEGLLTYETRDSYGWKRQDVLLKVAPGAALADTSGAPLISPQQRAAPGNGDAAGFSLALLLAFAGGLILNLMPCVFPILSIKALSMTKAAHGHASEMRANGLAFLGGVLLTFAILGGALIALKAGGAAIGWGFQLQSPVMVGALAVLFFALALNLLGAFDVAGAFQGVGGNLADRGGALGAFFTGALAVVVATPCTAPFMGAALGYGLTAPAWQSLMIFLTLGLGLAAPFTALAFAPALARKLPKPGPWMIRFKEFLAFPMLAAAVWLIWVLAQQAGANGVLAALAAMAGLALLIWAARSSQGVWRWALGGVGLAIVAAGLAGLGAPGQPTQTASLQIEAAESGYAPWSKDAVAQARAQGKTVFVNFTAAWCITCKLNEAVALQSDKVRAALTAPDVAAFTGDWTKRDSAIAAELAAHQRAGVPLYLVYKPGADAPEILPQILSEQIVLEALGKK